MDLKELCKANLRNQLQTTLTTLHENKDELHCVQLLDYLQRIFEHQIFVCLAFEFHNRTLLCMILRANVACKNSMIKLKVLNILHNLLTMYETYIATSRLPCYEGIILRSQPENGEIIRKIPSILIDDGLFFVVSQQIKISHGEDEEFCFSSSLDFLKRIALLQRNSSSSSPYYKRAVSILESVLRFGILNAQLEPHRNMITEFCLAFVPTLSRVPIKQQIQIITYFSKVQAGRKFPDKLLAAKLVTHCVNPNIRAKIEKLVSVWIDECIGKHVKYLTVNAVRILLFLMKPVVSMIDQNTRNESQSLLDTQYSQSLDDTQSICSQQSSVDSVSVFSGMEQCFIHFLHSPFRDFVKLFLEFLGDDDKELFKVLKRILLSEFPTSEDAGRYLELIQLLQLHDASIGEIVVNNEEFISFLEHQLNCKTQSVQVTEAFKVLCNILKWEKEQHRSTIPPELSERRIKMEISTLFAWLPETLVDLSHLEAVSLFLSYDLTTKFAYVQEVTEDSETLNDTLLSFQFHVLNLLLTVSVNLQAIVWRTLWELLCFAHRRANRNLHNSGELLQRMLLQRFFEQALFVVMQRSIDQSHLTSCESPSFTTSNLLCVQRWALLVEIQATNSQRFRSRIKRNFQKLPEFIRSLGIAFQQEINVINENESNLRSEVMRCLRDLKSTVF